MKPLTLFLYYLLLVYVFVMLPQPMKFLELKLTPNDTAYVPSSLRCSTFSAALSLTVPACVRYKFIFWRYVCFFKCDNNGELILDCAHNRDHPAAIPCDDLYCTAKQKATSKSHNSTTENVKEQEITTEPSAVDASQKSKPSRVEADEQDEGKDAGKPGNDYEITKDAIVE